MSTPELVKQLERYIEIWIASPKNYDGLDNGTLFTYDLDLTLPPKVIANQIINWCPHPMKYISGFVKKDVVYKFGNYYAFSTNGYRSLLDFYLNSDYSDTILKTVFLTYTRDAYRDRKINSLPSLFPLDLNRVYEDLHKQFCPVKRRVLPSVVRRFNLPIRDAIEFKLTYTFHWKNGNNTLSNALTKLFRDNPLSYIGVFEIKHGFKGEPAPILIEPEEVEPNTIRVSGDTPPF